MTRAMLCSGQGRVARGMFDLLAQNRRARAVFQAAAAQLGRDPVAFLEEASATELIEDRTGQILSVARALAAGASLEIDAPTMIAGYSVGEMAAWSLAGIWAPGRVLRLTSRRAELMELADGGVGGLGFVRGLDDRVLGDLLVRHGCAIAIRNPGRMYIIGGVRDDIARCCAAALGLGAAGARPIPVRIASHTPRLQGAVDPFLHILTGQPSARPDTRITLIGAADARMVANPSESLDGLARQLATTIDWTAVMTALIERGARRVLELGPGSALADMARGAWPGLEARSLDDFRTVEGAKRWFDA